MARAKCHTLRAGGFGIVVGELQHFVFVRDSKDKPRKSGLDTAREAERRALQDVWADKAARPTRLALIGCLGCIERFIRRDLDHDDADLLPGLDVTVGVGDRVERISSIDERAELPRLHARFQKGDKFAAAASGR